MAHNLKKFQTEAEYQQASLNYPAVSWVISGDTVHFDKTEPTSPKWIATYQDSHTESAECDATSAISYNEIELEYLESLEIGNCVTSIGQMAFEGCSSLSSVTIPDNVTSIGNMAFATCIGLTSVTIGSGVTSIGELAFLSSYNITGVTINATTPPTLGDTAFGNDSYPIYVPASSLSAYQSAWTDVASRIQAIPNS